MTTQAGAGVRRAAPLTKHARQARLAALIGQQAVRSQTELARLLAAEGVQVTQATLSRDLEDIGASKVRGPDGGLVYAVDMNVAPAEIVRLPLIRLCEELLVSAEANGDLVVLRTPPGAAQLFASALDREAPPVVMGTIAGDDTVLVVCRATEVGPGGPGLAEHLLRLADGRGRGAPARPPAAVPGQDAEGQEAAADPARGVAQTPGASQTPGVTQTPDVIRTSGVTQTSGVSHHKE